MSKELVIKIKALKKEIREFNASIGFSDSMENISGQIWHKINFMERLEIMEITKGKYKPTKNEKTMYNRCVKEILTILL